MSLYNQQLRVCGTPLPMKAVHLREGKLWFQISAALRPYPSLEKVPAMCQIVVPTAEQAEEDNTPNGYKGGRGWTEVALRVERTR